MIRNSSVVRGYASGTISITFAVFALNCYHTRRKQLWVIMWKWPIIVNFTTYCQKRDLDALWGPGFTPGDHLALFIWNKRTLLETVPEASDFQEWMETTVGPCSVCAVALWL